MKISQEDGIRIKKSLSLKTVRLTKPVA